MQRKTSTVNYLLRTGELIGVRLDGVLLVNKASVEAYRDKLPGIEAEREATKQRVAERRQLEKELQEKREQLDREYRERISTLKNGKG